MTAILTFTGAVVREPSIEQWFDSRPRELADLARPWFERMRRCGADVRELMHDGCPTACVGDAGFAYVNVFTTHVNVGFFQGALLPDPARLLEGTGKRMRHVKLKPGAALDTTALESLIADAYRDMQARARASR